MQEGLSHAIVFRIFQDKRGFIWFSTNYGLSRFDGKSFRNYYTQDGLSNNCIMSTAQQDDGSLLVSSYGGGISVLNDTSIRQLPYKKGTLPDRIIYAIPFNNKIWVTSPGQLNLYYIYDGYAHSIQLKNGHSQPVKCNKIVRCGAELLVASNAGLYHIDSLGNVSPFLKGIIEGESIDVRKDKEGGYWIGQVGKIVHVKNGAVVKTFPIDRKSVPGTMMVDSDNNVWIASSHEGIMLIKNDSLYKLADRINIHKIIINDILQDTEGNIWIATHGEGVYRLNSLNVVNYLLSEGVVINTCKAITAGSKNELYIGSMGTVSEWRDGKINRLKSSLLYPTQFIYFMQYNKDKLYIGTPLGMIIKQTKAPYKEKMLSPIPTPTGVLSLYNDGDSVMWLGSYVAVYKIKAGKSIIDSTDKVIKDVRCNAILKDRSGVMWMGTEKGLIAFKDGVFSHKQLTPKKSGNVVNALYEDSHNRLWIATDSGLACKEKNGYRIFTSKDGLTHNKCITIAEDKHNTLWIGTMNGLSTINLNSLDISEYRTDIYPDEVLSLYSRDSLLFVGTIDGLSIIETKTDISNSPPPLYITSVKTQRYIFNMPRSVSLPYKDNKLVIDFIGLSFRYPDMVEYRYKLDELNENWHVTNNSEIELSALPPGDYTFTLSARKNRGDWGAETKLPIHIDTPFWRAMWFIILSSLSVLVFIFFLTRWYITKREFKKRQQLSNYNKINYLKQQALSALINPHFIFNCLNSVQHYIFKRDHYKANIYLADFAQLIRMTMEHAQEVFIVLEKELSRIKLYLSLEQLRFGEGLEYEITISPDIETTAVRIPNMIVQPYVENAIWHGIMPLNGIGKISITVTKHNDKELNITIRDNGVGIDSSKDKQELQRQSYGMKLTEERLDLLKKLLGQYYTVTVSQAREGGTVVELVLPMEPDEEALKWIDEEFAG